MGSGLILGIIRKTLSTVSPKLCSHLLYYKTFRRRLDLQNPQTLNEKLMWLKLNVYDRDPLVTQCADKLRVREYVSICGWERTLNDLYGVYRHANEIPWAELPESFVLKCNHGCGYNLLCKDKSSLDIKAAKWTLRKWMREDYWKVRAELNYRGIPKRILCERYLEHQDGRLLEDYKFYCFHGKVFCIMVCVGREKQEERFYFFSPQWELMRINPDSISAEEGFTLPRPERLEDMLACAEQLSAPFPFVRVDLYEVEDSIVFGELTFTPSSALDHHRLPETDLLFGSLLKLPFEQNSDC